MLQLSGSYWKTCTLHAAVKLELFTAIGEKGCTVPELAQRLNLDERALAMLLNALTAMELLTKENNLFSNTQSSLDFLCKDSPKYIGFMIMHHYNLVESWNNLAQAVETGMPVRKQSTFADDETREHFLMGMFNNAMGIAPGLADKIDMSQSRRLLDLGGGPGTYAIHFCLKNPQLSAVIFDLPTSKPFAMKTVEKFGVSDRIEFVGGAYPGDPIPQGFDVAWLSHILHGESPEDCQKVIDAAVQALDPGGRLFIHDFILNDSMDGPLFPALFSLNMLLGTPGGQSYSETQLSHMMKKAGLSAIQRLDFRGPTESGIIFGTRK